MEFIEASNNVEQKMFTIAKQRNIPLNGVLELTPLCNMNCNMCYVKLNKDEVIEKGGIKDFHFWKEISNQLKESGVLFVLLTGGEPLLVPYFKELYIYLLKIGLVVTVNTNGTLIDEEWANFFEKNKPRRINITLYGTNENEYRHLCHYDGYNRTLKAIQLLKERNINVKLNGSITEDNKYSLNKLFNIANSLNVPLRVDTYMLPSKYNRKKINDCRLSAKEAAKFRVDSYFNEMDRKSFVEYAKTTIQISRQPVAEQNSLNLNCYAGKCSFAIDWQGNLHPCITMYEPYIKIEDSFINAWEKLKIQINNIKINNKCANCNLYHVCITCAANAYAENGDFEIIPEYLCEYGKYTIKYLKEKLNNLKD